jgi:hypothetical protein
MERLRRCLACCLAGALALPAAPVAGSPNVSLDDPVYDELDQRELAGELPAFRGGLAPLTRARIHEVLPEAPAVPAGWWVHPVERAALRLDLVEESSREYTTAARLRTVAGRLALSCERQEGRPCGEGLGLGGELDAAAGYGAWVAGALRLRARTGRESYASAVDLDRAYVNLELGPIAAEIGRDVLVLGPALPTQLGWGTNAPALDHVRLSGARPLALSSRIRVNGVYVLGQLAAPQSHPGALVSIARAQVDVDDRIELGAMQLLQLGGDGAPDFTPWGFVLEHVRRRDISAGPSDTSNRRVGLDVAVRIAGLGARVTYQLLFEDLRKRLDHAVRYDADHAVGVQTRWLAVQWRRTGVRAYEHMPRLTGFTRGGRIVGDPLGPAAQVVFAGVRLPVAGNVMPWAEAARLASDTYMFVVSGPIRKTGDGPAELRFRVGVRARVPLGHGLELDPEVAVEHVERASFVPGARHNNAVVRASLVWRPRLTASRLAMMSVREP